MTTLTGVRAVTFDCWGTLIYEPDPNASRVMRARMIADTWGIGVEDAEALHVKAWMAHVAAWERHEQFGSPGVLRFMHREIGAASPAPEDLLDAYEEIALEAGAVDVVPRAIETLEALKAAGLATALVCDTGLTPGRVVRQLLERFGVAKHLDAFAFSDEVGKPKPERIMFETALGAIGGGPAAHVGDLRRTDIAGARNAGLTAVRFRGIYDDASEHPEGDVVIDDLAALPGLIGLSA